jgi:hypothetical protein
MSTGFLAVTTEGVDDNEGYLWTLVYLSKLEDITFYSIFK